MQATHVTYLVVEILNKVYYRSVISLVKFYCKFYSQERSIFYSNLGEYLIFIPRVLHKCAKFPTPEVFLVVLATHRYRYYLTVTGSISRKDTKFATMAWTVSPENI